jgi:hypothetical protein
MMTEFLAPRAEAPQVPPPPDGIANNRIKPYLPHAKLLSFSAADASSGVPVRFEVAEIADDAWPILFERIFSPAPDPHEYAKLNEQWRLTDVEQWNHFAKLRAFVAFLDSWVASLPVPSDDHRVIVFNVMMSLFTHLYAEVPFPERISVFCEPLVLALFSGELTDATEAEVSLFAYLRAYCDRLKCIGISRQEIASARRQEANAVKKLLEKLSPSTRAMLAAQDIESLEFAQSELDVYFTRGRPISDGMLLIGSALSHKSISKWRIEMLAIALVLVEHKLAAVQRENVTAPKGNAPVPKGIAAALKRNAERFKSAFVGEIRSIGPRLLLWNLSELPQQ